MELQQLIGVDKKNPNFTLCRNPEDPGKIHVFFGATILEIVREDNSAPEWKLLIARLYNAGVKRKTLTEIFGAARTTMKRWGDALKSGSSELLLRALSGAGAPRKLTDEIKGFIELRFTEIYKDTRYGYSSRIRKEIKTVFNENISCETLRPIFNILKNKQSGCVEELKAEQDDIRVKGASICDCAKSTEATDAVEVAVSEEDASDQTKTPVQDNRKYSLSLCEDASAFRHVPISGLKPLSEYFFCNHVGVLIFSEMIIKLGECAGIEKGHIVKQWAMTILLGSINIEQTKLLDFDSLQALFGKALCRSLDFQRRHLLQLASEDRDNIKVLLRYNANIVNAVEQNDFYYDPHTKHYTGIKKILKG